MKELKFYICNHCGNIVSFVKNKGVPVKCCGENMHEIIPGSVEAAAEKHIPVIITEGSTVTVKVGDVAHPMLDAHYIEFIILVTDKEVRRYDFAPGEAPEAVFTLSDGDKAQGAYAYCNLHGLWKAEV